MPIINICDKGVVKLTPKQLEERVRRLKTSDVCQKLEQCHKQAETWIRKIRISHKAAISECAGIPIGNGRTRD